MERLPESQGPKDEQKKIEPVTISQKIQEIVDKINNMDKTLIENARVEPDLAKKDKKTNELPLKQAEVNVEPGKENEKANNPAVQKNDVIAVDAIKKEDSELAADKELSNVDNSVQRREQLEKTLEKHIMEQKEMMQEQKELLKDIEQQKKELQLAEKTESEQKNKNTGPKVNETSYKVKDKADGEKLKSDNAESEAKVSLQPLENGKSIVLENKESHLVVKNHENVVNNEIPMDLEKKKVETNQVDNEDPKNADSNLGGEAASKLIKKSENHIMKALTKPSNKISNVNEAANIHKEEKKNIDDKSKKTVDTRDEKNNEYSVPIVLKMNNKTKQISNSQNSQMNPNNINIAAVKRDILEDHEREKRMVEVEDIGVLRTALNEANEDKVNSIVDKVLNDEERICTKKMQVSERETLAKPTELNGEENLESLIQTSAYLSDQDVVKKLSIDSDLAAGDSSIKLKKGSDLETLKFENDNKK